MENDTGLLNAEFALVFPAGSSESTLCTSIPIIDDTLLEGSQDLTVIVAHVGPHALISTISATTTIVIADNECKICIAIMRFYLISLLNVSV